MTTKEERCPECGARMISVTLPDTEVLKSLAVDVVYMCPDCNPDLIKPAKKDK